MMPHAAAETGDLLTVLRAVRLTTLGVTGNTDPYLTSELLDLPWLSQSLTSLSLHSCGITQYPYVLLNLSRLRHLSLVNNAISPCWPRHYLTETVNSLDHLDLRGNTTLGQLERLFHSTTSVPVLVAGGMKQMLDVESRLYDLHGMKEFKEWTRSKVAQATAARLRAAPMAERGGKHAATHLVMAGPPGTGKTTAARILGHIMVEAGLLRGRKRLPHHPAVGVVEKAATDLCAEFESKASLSQAEKAAAVSAIEALQVASAKLRALPNNTDVGRSGEEFPFVEVSRPDLVGDAVGVTGQKTKAVVERALGGILFIDEAYAISDGEQDKPSYGTECISVLVKAMTDYAGELLIIFAGYEDKMAEFLQRNPGLPSRVKTINFSAYTTATIPCLTHLQMEFKDLVFAPNVTQEFLRSKIAILPTAELENSNGRAMERLVGCIIAAQAERTSGLGVATIVTRQDVEAGVLAAEREMSAAAARKTTESQRQAKK